MQTRYLTLTLVLIFALITVAMPPHAAEAHQPFCEFTDLTAGTPWQIENPSVSVAFYANLYPAGDVDYFTFPATAGQSIYLQMTIPDIEAQDDRFVPMMTLSGPGLETHTSELPDNVELSSGALTVPMVDEPEQFYEPFGGQYYWNWQDTTFEAPEDGDYTVAVWHPDDHIGRYTFVIGQKEILGGDMDCLADFGNYWTPLEAGQNPYRDSTPSGDDHQHSADETDDHAHDDTIDMGDSAAVPSVDLQVFSLGNGDYNVRIQTRNFEFAPQHVNQEHVPGEGHAHLYIDGMKITRIYGEWYYLETLPEGAQSITVTLYANDHRLLAVNGEAISATVTLSDME